MCEEGEPEGGVGYCDGGRGDEDGCCGESVEGGRRGGGGGAAGSGSGAWGDGVLGCWNSHLVYFLGSDLLLLSNSYLISYYCICGYIFIYI